MSLPGFLSPAVPLKNFPIGMRWKTGLAMAEWDMLNLVLRDILKIAKKRRNRCFRVISNGANRGGGSSETKSLAGPKWRKSVRTPNPDVTLSPNTREFWIKRGIGK
jgi:hypothetical protein